MNHGIKRYIFRYYLLISVAVFIGAVALALIKGANWASLAAICGGALSFAFGVQKQQLEEIKLFKELFEQFNRRYDELNEGLNRIAQPTDSQLNAGEKAALFKYFNLCGEEYLYFQQGFIYPEVWLAWKNGMRSFRESPRIRELWDRELKTYSYYGLLFEAGDIVEAIRPDWRHATSRVKLPKAV